MPSCAAPAKVADARDERGHAPWNTQSILGKSRLARPSESRFDDMQIAAAALSDQGDLKHARRTRLCASARSFVLFAP